MLKKLYRTLVPGPVRAMIRERNPYYHRILELQLQNADRCTQLQVANQQVVEKAQELQAVNQQIAEKEQELQTANQKIVEKEQELQAANLQIAEKEQKLQAASQQIVEKEQELQAANQQIAEKEQKLQAANQQIAEKEQELHTANQQIVEKEQKLQAANQQIVEKEQELQAANQQIVEKEQELQAANQQIIEKAQELQAANQQIAEKEQKLQAANQQIAEKEQELSTLTHENRVRAERLQAAYNSYRESLKHVMQNPDVREEHICKICGNVAHFSFAKKVMDKYDVSYFYCPNCNHIQTEKPYWLKEAYNSPLSDSDTGQVWRNERNRDIVCAFTHCFVPQPPTVLEYAGGYGLLTRMLRDAGLECFWYDKYAHNTFARHFEDDGKRKYDLVLAFEALEHFEDPMQELENIFKRGDSLLFSELLLQEPCPADWWYLCTEHGQHVNFYSRETMQYIADHFHKRLYYHEDIGLLTSLEIRQEDFDGMFQLVNKHFQEFQKSHHSLTADDMNTVIQMMKQP